MMIIDTRVLSIDDAKLNVRIHNSKNKEIALVLCHGFTGNGFGPFSDPIAKALSKDYLVCQFDFRGQGNSEGAFFDSSITRELEDLGHIIKHIKQEYFPKKIILIGHSFGAAIVTLYAAKHHNITAIISISGEGDLKKDIDIEFSPKQHEEFESSGKTQVINWSKDGELDTLGKQFLDDMKSYSTIEAIKKITCPILFIHGSEDDVLPFERSEEMFSLANSSKKLIKIENADHCFNVYTQKSSKVSEVIREIQIWLQELHQTANN